MTRLRRPCAENVAMATSSAHGPLSRPAASEVAS
jgi:hypothetical protein